MPNINTNGDPIESAKKLKLFGMGENGEVGWIFSDSLTPVANELGDDPELAVSQRLLTDSIADMEQSNDAAVVEATHQAGLAGDSAVIATEQAERVVAEFRTFVASSGFQFAGNYATGIEITQYNQIIRDENGEFWRVSGQVDLPYVTTGVGIPEDDALVPVGDAVLRQDLANPDKGAAMVARGVVAVDSIADLMTLPEGQRQEGLRYLVKGYHAGSDVGGGEFIWNSGRLKSHHDGGYTISPTVPYSQPLESFLDGVGESSPSGPGCFVRVPDADVRPDDFGAYGDDISDDHAALSKSLNYSVTRGRSFYLPPRVYRSGQTITIDAERKGINIRGDRGKSTIRTDLVGQTTLEVIDTQTSSISDIVIRGNGEKGPLGSGHGLVIYDSDITGDTYFPQGCTISGLRVGGFQGNDVDPASGDTIESCGILIAGGKFTQFYDLNVSTCTHGLYITQHGQTIIHGSTFVACPRWGVVIRGAQSGVAIDDCDIVSCGGDAGTVGSPYSGGGVFCETSRDTLNVTNCRTKTSNIGVCALSVPVVNINGCTLEAKAHGDGGDSVVVFSLGTVTNISGNAFICVNTLDPLNTIYSYIRAILNVNSGDITLNVENNLFSNNCVIEHCLSITGLGFSRVTTNIRKNQFGRTASTELNSTVESCIKLRGVTISGSITDNTIAVGGKSESGTLKVVKVLDVDSQARIGIENCSIERNRHREYLVGVIEEPMKPTRLTGTSTLTTNSSGLLTIETPLVRTERNFKFNIQLNFIPVFAQINSIQASSVTLRVYDKDGVAVADQELTVHWEATCTH